jgi:ArsR family transcriptional regulator
MARRRNCCDIEASAAQTDLANRLKALAHPARLEIVRQLVGRTRCCCNDFCATLPLAQSTISQHLDLLCQAGLVVYAPDGNRSAYQLEPKALAELAGELARLTFAADAKSGDNGDG